MADHADQLSWVASSLAPAGGMEISREMGLDRIVVTGGAGFIGTHTTAALLESGCKVMVIDDLRHACGQPIPSEVEHVRGDIGGPEASAAIIGFRPDGVIHLAAQGGVSRSIREPVDDAQVNVLGTVAMLKAAADSGCRRFVFSSSGGAIYGRPRRLPSTERDVAQPLSPYGTAKLAAEAYLGMFSRTFGLSTVALRYANIYGPFQDGTGEAGFVAISCHRLAGGRPPRVTGDGAQTRDFTFVGDVARANLAALNSTATGPYNIGTGKATSIGEAATILAQVAGYKGSSESIPGRSGEVRHTRLDASRAARTLGWAPAVSLESGFRTTFESFRHGRPTSGGGA